MSRSSSKVVKIDTPYDDECNDEGLEKEDQFAFMSRKVRNMWKKRSGSNHIEKKMTSRKSLSYAMST